MSESYKEFSNMFSRLFKKTTLLVSDPNRVETPAEEHVGINKTMERVDLFLGHTVTDSSGSETQDDDTRTKYISDDTRYFQESFVDTDESPCGSYVDITEPKHFDPMDVETNSDTIATFIRLPLPMSLLSVPGISMVEIKMFEKNGVHNTHQLIGHFLLLRDNTTSSVKLADKFYDWLGEVGVHKNRATITASVAEKIGTWIPGFYDTNVYTSW